MDISSRLLEALLRLPPPETRDIVVERDIPVTMPDGVVLLADRYFPREALRPPTLLVRCPYGRTGFFGALFGRVFAERGFQVLLQSVRGTFGSGGTLDPFRQEGPDGLATVAWMQRQHWYGGTFGTVGLSYLGLTQWAISKEAGPDLRAMAPMVTASQFQEQTYAGGAFSLYNGLSWTQLMHHQEHFWSALKMRVLGDRLLRPVFRELPLETLDQRANGASAPFYQDWLRHNDADSAWWKPGNFDQNVPQTSAPVSLVGGWQDIFLPWQLDDYRRLREAGRDPFLLVGPWTHVDPQLLAHGIRDALAWQRAHLLGDASQLRPSPVRLFVTGAKEWRDYAAWPPPSRSERWYLQAQRGLGVLRPSAAPPDLYRYDPADPTPSLGGPLLGGEAGVVDNRPLEARPDVLCYTSERLGSDVEVIGEIRAELFVRSSLSHADFFVRLCDVNPRGVSRNVCDGLLRVSPQSSAPDAEGVHKLTISLWPAAHRFRRGHRIRVQVSSGAHPRYARNLGTGEALASGTRLVAAEQAVFHDPTHPSAILLPVVS
jgi:hypothetical protein